MQRLRRGGAGAQPPRPQCQAARGGEGIRARGTPYPPANSSVGRDPCVPPPDVHATAGHAGPALQNRKRLQQSICRKEPYPASYFSSRRGAGAQPYFVYGKRLQQSIGGIEPHPASYFSPRRGAGARPYFVYGKRLQQNIGGIEPQPRRVIFRRDAAQSRSHTLCMASGCNKVSAE